jgi:hypothetical protein
MSAEKGLAWFDLGNGKIVKGRSFWFNAVTPETWEGREFLVRPERFEMDEIGLADWVDEQILSQEQQETSTKFAPKAKPVSPEPAPPDRRGSPAASTTHHQKTGGTTGEGAETPSSSFKISLTPRGPKARGSVISLPKSVPPPPDPPSSSKGKGDITSQAGKKGKSSSQAAEPPSPPPKGGAKIGPFKVRK